MRKHKFLAVLLALVMALSLLPTAAFAEEADEGISPQEDETVYAAQIGSQKYETLGAAIAQVQAGETIEILRDIPDAVGISVAGGKNFTIDFGGFTYTLTGPGAGSENTETNGFQLLKNSTITFENGIIRIAQNANDIKRIIQNYADLTLDDMTFYAENQVGGESYPLSFNYGNIVFKGNTSIITTSPETAAFDVYYWDTPTYKEGVSVTFEDDYTGNINGKIIYDSKEEGKASLEINGNGSFGGIKLSSDAQQLSAPDIAITGGDFDDNVNAYVVKGMTQDGDGKVVIDTKTAVAEVNGIGYPTLQGAINAAAKGGEVTLLKSIAEDITIAAGQDITLDLGGNTLTNNTADTISVAIGGELTVTGDGTVDNKTNGTAAIFNEGTVVLNGGTYDRTSEKGESADVSGGNSWYTICNHGEMEINDGATVKNTGSFSSMIENGYQSYSSSGDRRAGHISGTNAANPSLTINGGTFIGGLNTVKNDDGGILTIHNGSFRNTTQASILNWNKATITGGDFECTAANCVLNGASSSSSSEHDSGELEIQGGSFISKGMPVQDNFRTGAKVSGGNYSNSIPQSYLKDVNVELHSTAVNPEAPYSYYQDTSKAIKAATDAGDTDAVVKVLDSTVTLLLTVNLNANGGTVSVTTIQAKAGEEVALPAAVWGGYTFLGWSDGSNTYQAGDTYTVADGQTLTALWRANSSGGSSSGGSSGTPTYAVTVDSGRHGTVTVSPKSARKGAAVTITVKPDDGYELDGLTVTDASGKAVKVTEGKNGKFTFTMPASKVEVEASFTAIKEETPARRFTDVPDGYWAEDEIHWAADSGYMNGNTAATFNPEGTVTRQQLWMILARLSGYQPADFDEARAWAMDNSISDGTNPGGAVSRQQLVTILYRYAERMGHNTAGSADLTAYPDHAGVAAYATGAMGWSVANGIVGGTAAGTLNPAGTATRAQFAAILYRFCDKIAG